MDASKSKSKESTVVERESSPISKVSRGHEQYQVTESEDYQKLTRDSSGLKKDAGDSKQLTFEETIQTEAVDSSADSVPKEIIEEVLESIFEEVSKEISKEAFEESIIEVLEEDFPIDTEGFRELSINLSSLPALLVQSTFNNPSEIEESLLKRLVRRSRTPDSTETKFVVAQPIKCSTDWTSIDVVDTSQNLIPRGRSYKYGGRKVLNMPSILLWSDWRQKLRDSVHPSDLAFSIYGKLVPFNNCFKVKLPAIICCESDLNSDEIYVPIENRFEVTIPLLVFCNVEDSLILGMSERVLSSDSMNLQGDDNVEEELTSSGHYSGNTQRIGQPVNLVAFTMNLDSMPNPSLNL